MGDADRARVRMRALESRTKGPIMDANRNAIARVFANWQNPQFMKLHAGEMTAQEVRTVKAIVNVIAWEINEILKGR